MFFLKTRTSKAEQLLSLRQASLGCVFTGRIGSGKSTGLRQVLKFLEEQGAYLCICCIKPDEADVMGELFPDAVKFTPSSHKFNLLDYEMSREGGSSSNLAAFHDDLSEVLTRADSQKQEAFWKGGAHDTLTHAFELAHHVRKLQGKQATYSEVYDIIMTSPQSLVAAASPEFRKSPCGIFIEALGRHDPALAEKYCDWFMKRMPSIGDKARGAFVTQSLNSIKPFVHGPIAETVNGQSTITPETMMGQHTILAFDTLTYGVSGLAFNLMVSWLCMECVLRRKGDFPYFALVRDEYHQLAHAERDVRTQAVGRSQKFIGINAFQSLPVLEAALGGGLEAQTQSKALYGLHVNKFMMSQNCHVTNDFNSMVIGQEKRMFFSGSQNQSQELPWYDVLGVGAAPNFGYSQQWHYRVPPTAFMGLRAGGPDNDWTCDAIYHCGLDGYETVSFKQR